MKKAINIFILLAVVVKVNAQADRGTFRLLGAANMPKYRYENLSGTSSRDVYPGYAVALLLSGYDDSRYNNVKSKPKFGYHLGIEYTQKGAINNVGGTGFTKSKNRINYLQGDLMGSLGLGKNRSKGSFADILVGGYFATALSGKQDITATNGNTTSTSLSFGTDVLKNDFIKFDLGIKAGLLFTISSKLSLGAFYERGISDIAPQDNVKVNNRNIQLMAGFNFGYKK